MAGFRTIRELVDAELNGASIYSTWRKNPTQATTVGIWFDLSMSPGLPVGQYYASASLVGVPMSQSSDGGIYHGGDVSPANKYISRLTAIPTGGTSGSLPMILCDYLYYYPFIDESITDEQVLTTSASMTRYTNGVGVQMMAVVVAGQAGGQSFQVRYTNSDGVANRVSKTVVCNAQALNGTILNSNSATAGCAGPFIPLQTGDVGIRSIQGITMNGADFGLFTLVLVKPLANLNLMDSSGAVEVNYFKDFGILPRIVDDAYLNLICYPSYSLASAGIYGDITVVWK